MASGVYSITNTVDGKVYIGSGQHIHKRWIAHRTLLRRNRHDNTHLQNAWNTHGEEAFAFAVIKECPKDETLFHEQIELDRAFAERPRQEIYNVGRCATAAQKGRKHSMLTILRRSIALQGKKRTPDTRARMSVAQRGRTLSEEARRNISASKSGSKHPMWGKTFSEERRQHMSRAIKGRHYEGRALENIRAAARSQERREKLSAALKGRPFTEEHHTNWVVAMLRRKETLSGCEQDR